MTERCPILLVDFDGVIHSYTTPWEEVWIIPDPPVPGAISFLKRALDHFDVQIYSSRSQHPSGLVQIKNWIAHLGGPSLVERLSFPTQKPAAFLTIDDRCLCFNGTWPDPEELLRFKSWNKKDGGA